jgi:hypothetical protein
MKQYFLFILVVFSPFLGFSQYQSGMRLERYAGLYGTAINPAALSFTPARWEVSLGALDVFAHQNYGRALRTSVPDVLRNPELLTLLEDIANNPDNPGNAPIPVDFFNRGRVFGQVQTRVSGPGFALRLAQQHSIGLSISARFMLSSYRIPSLFRYENINDLEYGQTYNVDKVKLSTMAWNEIAGHYAYRNFDGDIMFSAGITPKLLSGFQGAYAAVNADFNYTPISADTIDIGSANWAFGFTNDIVYANDPATYRPRANGFGGGVDLGFSWAMPKEDPDAAEDYLWRAGVSLLDVGAVRFNRNAEAHRIQFSQIATVAGDTLAAAATIGPEQAVRTLSDVLLGDPNASRTANAFTVGLPTVLSAQFDYGFTPRIYVQGVVMQRLPLFKNALKSPNMLAVVPRFEHQWLSVSVPLVLDDYRFLRVGVAARLGILYFGTDNLLSWTGQRSLTGTDLYAGVKINGFKIRGGKKRQSNRGGLRAKDRRWKNVGCYNQ